MDIYTIHTTISSIMRDFACFEYFDRFQLYKPKTTYTHLTPKQEHSQEFMPNTLIQETFSLLLIFYFFNIFLFFFSSFSVIFLDFLMKLK